MKVLLKKVKIVQPQSSLNQQVRDIAIESGKITQIGKAIAVKGFGQVIKGDNLHVSPGFFDIGTLTGEPGNEHQEDLQSIAAAAAVGGYTEIACFPNTDPIIDSKATLSYIQSKNKNTHLKIYPIAAISDNTEGKEITEMVDLHHHGAIAFSDGTKPVKNDKLFQLASQYVVPINGLIINRPDNKLLSGHGQVHESLVSAEMGLVGIPDMAEEMGLMRDLYLTAYAGNRYLAYAISSKNSIKRLNEGRKQGLKLFAAVMAAHLVFTADDMMSFDPMLKVLPPFRDKTDRKALRNAVKNNSIDIIVSGHQPLETEAKEKDFALAEFGISGLETAFSLANSALDEETLVSAMAVNPRKVLDLPVPQIKEGEKANLTVFNPTESWVYSESKSKGKNSPLLGKKLKGRVVACVNRKKWIIN
jgi:dihydroorotase